MPAKAASNNFAGRFREIISDPLNLLIRRHPEAGVVTDGLVTLHNGHRVPLRGPHAYYEGFSDILIYNRGVHEPLEEFAFQEMLAALPPAPAMLELGAYWGHYSMWLKQARPAARVHLVEPEAANLAAGRENFARHGYAGSFEQAFVGTGQFEVDRWMGTSGLDRLTILHSDIQGFEGEMLDGAQATLGAQRADYVFISTHDQSLHEQIRERMAGFGYRVELSSDFDAQTTSYDGFLLAVHPDRPPVCPGPAPLDRSQITSATPRELVDSLLPRLRPTASAPCSDTR